jgi:hypothetical protein
MNKVADAVHCVCELWCNCHPRDHGKTQKSFEAKLKQQCNSVGSQIFCMPKLRKIIK